MKAARPTLSRVARILERHPVVKKVWLETRAHKVDLRFYDVPSDDLLAPTSAAAMIFCLPRRRAAEAGLPAEVLTKAGLRVVFMGLLGT